MTLSPYDVPDPRVEGGVSIVRSSGPGGQHRNKVETKVTLTHTQTDTSAQAGERRSQGENKRVALQRLRFTLAVEHRCPVPPGDVRSELWRSRVKGGKIIVSPTHHDLAPMLAEALDVLSACHLDFKKAATRLECTPSQLIKMLKKHPPAFQRANADRTEHSLGPLK